MGKTAYDSGIHTEMPPQCFTIVSDFFNSLAPRKFEWHFIYVIFRWILVVGGWGISCEIALILMSLHFTDDQSTLVQVMAWCRQATSHYLSQCWPTSLSPYGVTRAQWVNDLPANVLFCHRVKHVGIWVLIQSQDVVLSVSIGNPVMEIRPSHLQNGISYTRNW